MFVTKRSLPRRTFLSGMGVVVGLPLLEAMVPAFTALAQSAASPKPRFGAVYFPNGAIVDQWIPEQVGAGFDCRRSRRRPFQSVSRSNGSSHLTSKVIDPPFRLPKSPPFKPGDIACGHCFRS